MKALKDEWYIGMKVYNKLRRQLKRAREQF